MEYAFENAELTATSELRPSVFTRAVVEGLETGDADRDQDGYVGLDELYDYVYDRVHEVTPNQTPGKWTFGIQGELHIARRRGSVTKPVALPKGCSRRWTSLWAGSASGRCTSSSGCSEPATQGWRLRPGRLWSASETTIAERSLPHRPPHWIPIRSRPCPPVSPLRLRWNRQRRR